MNSRQRSAIKCDGQLPRWLYGDPGEREYGCRAALINPAVRPHELLCDYLAPDQPYSGERYELLPVHMDELRALAVPVTAPERLWCCNSEDEVLDYRRRWTNTALPVSPGLRRRPRLAASSATPPRSSVSALVTQPPLAASRTGTGQWPRRAHRLLRSL